jgi:DNA polymerase-3 subunit epsilon
LLAAGGFGIEIPGGGMRATALSSLNFVVIDFETTGLDAVAGDEIIEIGAVRIDGKQITGKSFHALVNPQRALDAQATAIHGISDADLHSAPLIAEIFPKFLQFIGHGVVVAQNARFDLAFLVKNLTRMRVPRFENLILDTMLLSKFLFSYESRHNLDSILQRLRITVDGSVRHRSLGDCQLTAQALVAMLDLLERRGLGTVEAVRSCLIKAPPIPIKEQGTLEMF